MDTIVNNIDEIFESAALNPASENDIMKMEVAWGFIDGSSKGRFPGFINFADYSSDMRGVAIYSKRFSLLGVASFAGTAFCHFVRNSK